MVALVVVAVMMMMMTMRMVESALSFDLYPRLETLEFMIIRSIGIKLFL